MEDLNIHEDYDVVNDIGNDEVVGLEKLFRDAPSSYLEPTLKFYIVFVQDTKIFVNIYLYLSISSLLVKSF